MGIEMELDSKKKFPSDLSPDTVLPPQRHCSNNGRRSANNEVFCKDEVLRVKEGFTEISFRRYRSSSCRNPPRPGGLQGNIELKRGSEYESSREVRKMNKMGPNEGRKKIELSCGSDTSLSFKVVDSLCSSDEENTENRCQSMYVKSSLISNSDRKPVAEPCSSGGFIEICPDLGQGGNHLAGNRASGLIEHSKFRCEVVLGPRNDGNDLLERDAALTFHKSLSAKVDMVPRSPSASDSDSSSRASARSRFSPIRKMFDPFVKSKSLRSPLGHTAEPGDVKTIGMANMSRNQTLRKSLLHDFSHAVKVLDFESRIPKKDHHQSSVASSPVHLNGHLKLDNRHGVPFYEFSLNCPEEVFVAKTWKSNSAFNWVYTFHSICHSKKSNASGWGLTDVNKESLLVGQMQVSCYSSSESHEERACDNSMVTEFVLYDIAHARQHVSAVPSSDAVTPSNSNPFLVSGTNKVHDESDAVKLNDGCRQNLKEGNAIGLNLYPCASEVLHPGLEIAAIVIQFPFAKRESLKYKRGEINSDKKQLNLLNLPMAEEKVRDMASGENSEKVKVVIPNGHHSLATGESQGPSSLLHRWRFGGGCDCGGWDMACPLTVLGNPGIKNAADQLVDNQQPLELFVQGKKEKMPALTMTIVEKGHFAVDFHAQLSTLQAFSICVAMLHSTEASGASVEEISKQMLECISLKFLIEDEGKLLTKAAREEEKNKVLPKMEEIQRSYVLNPPFSPMSRV